MPADDDAVDVESVAGEPPTTGADAPGEATRAEDPGDDPGDDPGENDELDVVKVGGSMSVGDLAAEQLADGGAQGESDIVPDISPAGVTPEVLAALTADDDGDLSDDDFELSPPVIDVAVVTAPQPESADDDAILSGTAPSGLAALGGAVRGTRGGEAPMLGISALSSYLHELRRHSLLSRDEEHELAVRFSKTGDSAAARRLITANLRLVVKISQEYRRAHKNLLDLIQEGNIGLIQAVQKYDPYRGVKLSSYAAWWIRAYILKFILANWRIVKIGTTQAQRKLFFNLRKEREKLEKAGFEVEARHLAAALDVSEQDVVEMERRLGSSETSLDSPVRGDESGGRTQGDFVPAAASMRPDIQVEVGEFQELLRQKLEAFGATLKDRELDIFRDRLLNDSPATLQEIGEKYGVSRERARQIEERLKKKLRNFLQSQLGDAVQVSQN
jgi:RNA polymerase sigma-32 factor